MVKSSTHDPIKLEVSDFGPIIEAKVDLRPLTVFIGPSNTGKSYLAILLYALHKSFNRASIESPRGVASLQYGNEMSRNERVAILTDFMKQALAEEGKFRDERIITFHNPVLNLLQHRFKLGLENFNSEITRCFGLDDALPLVRHKSSTEARIALHWRGFADSKLSVDLTHKSSIGFEIKVDIPSEIQLQLKTKEIENFLWRTRYWTEEVFQMVSSKERGNAIFLSLYLDDFNKLVFPQIFAPLHQTAFYLPADRTGVMHAHNVVVRALIGNAPMAGLRPDSRMPMLSGVLADFLQQLIEMDSSSNVRRRSKFNLDSQIEKTILDGVCASRKIKCGRLPAFYLSTKGMEISVAIDECFIHGIRTRSGGIVSSPRSRTWQHSYH